MFMVPFIIMACFLLITLYHLVYKNWKTLSGLITVYEFRLKGCQRKKRFRRTGRGIQRRNRGCADSLGEGRLGTQFQPHPPLPSLSQSNMWEAQEWLQDLKLPRVPSLWSKWRKLCDLSSSICNARWIRVEELGRMPEVKCCCDIGEEEQDQDLTRWVWAYCQAGQASRMGLGFTMKDMSI